MPARANAPAVLVAAGVVAGFDSLTHLQIAPEPVVWMRVAKARRDDPEFSSQIVVLYLDNFAPLSGWLGDPDITDFQVFHQHLAEPGGRPFASHFHVATSAKAAFLSYH